MHRGLNDMIFNISWLTYTNLKPFKTHQYEHNKEINPSTLLKQFSFQDNIIEKHTIYNQFISKNQRA